VSTLDIGVLEHFQDRDAKPSRHLPAATAKTLVTRLLAEEISQKKIRLLPPDSICRAGRGPLPIPERLSSLALPPIEPDGHTFYPPLTVDWQVTHSLPTRHLREKAQFALADLKVKVREEFQQETA
jgi:hypothetical protein